ncbi:extracellular calcium-sensing receptor-like [Lissotriton helveticus]
MDGPLEQLGLLGLWETSVTHNSLKQLVNKTVRRVCLLEDKATLAVLSTPDTFHFNGSSTLRQIAIEINDNSQNQKSPMHPASLGKVGYAAVHDVLSDKAQFPSFLRTVPPMRPQSTAFALLMKNFGWTWIGLLFEDNDTCYMRSKYLGEDLKSVGVCVSFWEKIHDNYSKSRIRSIAERIRSSSARVIICDCYEMELKPLLQELSDLNVTDRMWIFSTSLTISPDYFPRSSLRLLNGSLVMALHAPDMSELKPFLESLHPSRFPEDIFIHAFWEAAFGCKWTNNASSSGSGPVDARDGELQCTGTEVLDDVESMFVLSDMSYTYHMYLAVYALAQALQDLISCTPGMGPFQNSSCAEVEHPKPWQEESCGPSHGFINYSHLLRNAGTAYQSFVATNEMVPHGNASPLHAQMCPVISLDKHSVHTGCLQVHLDSWKSDLNQVDFLGRCLLGLQRGLSLSAQLEIHLCSSLAARMSAGAPGFLEIDFKPGGSPGALSVGVAKGFEFGKRHKDKMGKTRQTDNSGNSRRVKFSHWSTGDEAQMLHYVKSVRFNTSSGEEILFDENGDVPAVFDFINIQLISEGSMRLVKVVTYDSSAPEGKQIRIEEDAMMWNTGDNQAPSSFCSESCFPGFRQSARKGWPVCCFDCVPCSAGEISNETDSPDCWPCPEDHWPNEERTRCVLTTLQFLSLEEPLGITLSCLSSLLILITLLVLCILKKYQDTPIVKANNRELSYVLLIGLMLCFLSPFTFIGQPMKATCMIHQNSFGIIFSISISTILAKTITVIIAFNARDPTSRSSRWLGTRVPYSVVLLCSFAPVLICTVWLLLDPPFLVKMQIQDITILQSDEGSVLFFYLMLGYLGLLATVSFVVAFYARNLPQSFNEAKLLTFSMLVFLAVWISFIPAYLSTQGKYLVAVEIFAILSSGAGLLGCIFIPKCYIILWRPDMNTKQYLMQRPISK